MEKAEKKRDYYRPTQNGFGVMIQSTGTDKGPAAQLYYKGTNVTPILVWPYIGTWGDPILYSNDIAILLADKPDEQGRLGSGNIIAVQGVGPAMDISDDLLKISAEQSNFDFSAALKAFHANGLTSYSNRIDVNFGAPWFLSTNVQRLTANVSWEQVLDIMHSVKEFGTTNVVSNTGVRYLRRRYLQ